LPFEGYWFVSAAGDTINVNHHMSEPSQFYGIDFAKLKNKKNRILNINDGTKLEHYFSFNANVLSPISGKVIYVENKLPDNPIGTYDKQNAFGNHILIETPKKDYVFLAHFKNSSIIVKKDDMIEQGQLLGKCGNSGNSDYPHIHMHVQNTPIPYKGYGVNIEFKKINVELNEKKFINVTWPLISGLFVEPSEN